MKYECTVCGHIYDEEAEGAEAEGYDEEAEGAEAEEYAEEDENIGADA